LWGLRQRGKAEVGWRGGGLHDEGEQKPRHFLKEKEGRTQLKRLGKGKTVGGGKSGGPLSKKKKKDALSGE